MSASSARVKFLVAWAVLLAAKLALAASLAPFGDEAFYAWEARHLAMAYSDLPGLTAWLVRLGLELGGASPLAMRAPFLLIGAALPWLVRRIAARWFGEQAGWQAALLSLLLPLAAVSGVLALPDVPLALAALLCADAVASLQRRLGPGAVLQLAVGLALGAFAHYRFAAIVLAGAVGLLLVPSGRALLRRPAVWLALAVGAAAWAPLLWWNATQSGAGLAFQLVERHPWRFHGDGAYWPLLQALVVTPGLFLLLLAVLAEAWKRWRATGDEAWGLLLGSGGVAALAYFPLAFFADSERLSLHWPHPGWLLLLSAAPLVLGRWPPWARAGVWAGGAAGTVVLLGYLAVAATPAWRASLAASAIYPDNFAGWPEVAAAVRDELAGQPGSALVADNFMLGAQLAFALPPDAGRLSVLDHPLNHKHGRSHQLAIWGLLRSDLPQDRGGPVLLVVEDTARPLKHRLSGYHGLCGRVGALPPPRVLNIDHGRKRFLLFRLPRHAPATPCTTPALAWIDTPAGGAALGRDAEIAGWAFKDGVGIERVEVTLDGRVVAQARYGEAMPRVAAYWQLSTDPRHPHVGFRARLGAGAAEPGRHWLGLRLHGRDGSIEDWPAQPVEISR